MPKEMCEKNSREKTLQEIVYGNWEDIPEYSSWKASKDALMIGPCPHSWLFQHVAAVIHHGGAGTTHSGIFILLVVITSALKSSVL